MPAPADEQATTPQRTSGEESPPPVRPRHAAFSFSLRSLLLVMTLAAPVSALAAFNHYFGLLLAVVLVLALLRTRVVVRNLEAQGQNVVDLQKLSVLAISLGRITGLVYVTVLTFILIFATIALVDVSDSEYRSHPYFVVPMFFIGVITSTATISLYLLLLVCIFRQERKTLSRYAPVQGNPSNL